MSHLAAVSFDADAIRVIKAIRTRGSLSFERTLTLTAAEFEEFLAVDRSTGYLVSLNPPDALYETITIPPVETKLTGRIVQTELRHLHPEISKFSVSYRVIGDSVQEGRTIRRVACCIVPEDLLISLLEPFIRHNRPVRQMATSPWLLAHLASSADTELPQTLLCAYDEGERKTLLVQEQGAVVFTRQVPSEGRGWNSFDRQNVTMTLDYCFQSLRIRPGGAIALNSEDPPPPFFPFEPAVPAGLPADILQEYPSQAVSLAYPLRQAEDLRPPEYCKTLREQDLIRTATRGFAVAVVVLAVMLAVQGYLLTTMTANLNSMRQNPVVLQTILTNYQAATEKRTAVEPLITLLNSRHAEPSLPALLASLNLARLPGITIQNLAVKRDKEGIQLTLTGVINDQTLSGAQARFEELGRRLNTTPHVKLGANTLDPKDQKFSMEARYTP
jgi:hypothetical protein